MADESKNLERKIVARREDVVDLLWFVVSVVASGVDVCDSVVLRVEGVCGSELFSMMKLSILFFSTRLCDRRGNTNVRAVRS